MYVTAQRVRNAIGASAIHSYLHRHDASHPMPSDRHQVPFHAPGVLVHAHTPPPQAGGNTIVSFLDLIVDDGRWSRAWIPHLWTARTYADATPMVVQVGEFLVMFDAQPDVARVPEYEELLAAAIGVLH